MWTPSRSSCLTGPSPCLLLACATVFATVCAAIGAAASARAAEIHVCPDGSGDHGTIAGAAAVAASGDTIRLCPDDYIEADIVLPGGVTLIGDPGAPEQVVIDAGDAGRIFILDGLSGLTTVSGVSLRDGFAGAADDPLDAGGAGGAILCRDARLRLEHCFLVSNKAEGSGGAVALIGARHVEIAWCTFFANGAAGDGGALHVSGAAADIAYCDVSYNTAGGAGGAFAVDNADAPALAVSMSFCSLYQNRAETPGGAAGVGVGGGLDVRRCGDFGLFDSTVKKNRAAVAAAGLEIGPEVAALVDNVDLFDNDAPACTDIRIDPEGTSVELCVLAEQICGDFAEPPGCRETGLDARVPWGRVKAVYR